MGASATGDNAPPGTWNELVPVLISFNDAEESRFFNLHTAARLDSVIIMQETAAATAVLNITADLGGSTTYATTVITELDLAAATDEDKVAATMTDKTKVWPKDTNFKLVTSGDVPTALNVIMYFKPLA